MGLRGLVFSLAPYSNRTGNIYLWRMRHVYKVMSQYERPNNNRFRGFGKKVKSILVPEGMKLYWVEDEYHSGPVNQTRHYSFPEDSKEMKSPSEKKDSERK